MRRARRMLKQSAGGTPVLMFHHLAAPPLAAKMKGFWVTRRSFSAYLRHLQRSDHRTTTLEEAAKDPVQQRQVVISFDDGYVDVFANALPELVQHHAQAIVFLVADHLGGTNYWDVRDLSKITCRLMEECQVREWLASGQQIGAHTRTHRRLTTLSRDEAREEIAGSRRKLEDQFGCHVRHFSYPFGDMNEAVRELVAEAGYETASTVQDGVWTERSDRFALPRKMALHRYPGLVALLAAICRTR